MLTDDQDAIEAQPVFDDRANDTRATAQAAPQPPPFDWRYALAAGFVGGIVVSLINAAREEYDR